MTIITFIFFILVLLFSLKYAWWAPSINKNETRIMMYHMISDQPTNSKKSGLRVSPNMFEKHLEYFSNNGWTFIKMSEIEEYDNSEKVVAITFDDGYLDNYTQAYPFGIYEDVDIEIVSNSDFNSAVSTNEGIASLKSIYDLKRIKASGKDNFFAFKIRVLKGFRGYI